MFYLTTTFHHYPPSFLYYFCLYQPFLYGIFHRSFRILYFFFHFIIFSKYIIYWNKFVMIINNIAWTSKSKSKLQAFYHHQKHAATIINFKYKFTSAKPLLEQTNATSVYKMNISQTLCFMCLCENGNTASIFKHIYMLKPIVKCTTRSKNVLLKNVRKTLQNLS